MLTKTITYGKEKFEVRELTLAEFRAVRQAPNAEFLDQVLGKVLPGDKRLDALPMSVARSLAREVMALTAGSEEAEKN